MVKREVKEKKSVCVGGRACVCVCVRFGGCTGGGGTGRQTWMGRVKDTQSAQRDGGEGKMENGEFKMTVCELTASSLFLPY